VEVEKLVSMTVLPEVTWVLVTGHTVVEVSTMTVVITSDGAGLLAMLAGEVAGLEEFA
jgi:hypothetical protein